jgi:endonuclease/exonuclease/phosphatase family metal-dependent hydrolase
MRLLLAWLMFLSLLKGVSQELSVMTYNIRLDWGNDQNSWTNRKEPLLSQIQFYEPDIFGIQEGLPHQVSYLDSALEAYSYIGVGRDDGKWAGEYSAIYFKTADFKLLNQSTFWLSTTPDLPSLGWDAAIKRICTYALFQRNADGRQFWIFNTHFDHVGVKARENSMELILSKIDSLNKKNLPVVLMGDLNLQPHETPIVLAKGTLQDSREVADLVFGIEGTFNGFNFENVPTRRIDYVFINEHFSVNKYAVLSEALDLRYISDHFPVYCLLSFRE